MSNLLQVLYDRLLEIEDFIRYWPHGDLACENAVKSITGTAHAEAMVASAFVVEFR